MVELNIRLFESSVDDQMSQIVLALKTASIQVRNAKSNLINFISTHQTEWQTAYSQDERDEIMNLDGTLETILTYIDQNLPDVL